MKKSIYNYILPYENDSYIIYNTLNARLIILDKKHFELYESLGCDKWDVDMIQTLSGEGMIVEDTMDEKTIVDFDRGLDTYQNRKPFFRILTTTACNAKCPYCYEAGVKAEKMTLNTAASIVKFIKKQTVSSERFTIGWFGGEPLMNTEVMDYISSEIDTYAKETGKIWNSTIITNGSLFKDEFIKKAASSWKTNNIQITLDGTKHMYEEIKQYSDGTTFETVVQAINKLISSGIFISIRLNYNNDNYEDIINLINYLGSHLDVNCDNWEVYPYPLFDNSCHETCSSTVFGAVKLEEEIQRIHGNRFETVSPLPQYISGRCGACSINSFVILPNGDLIKCSRYMNLEKPFGNVRDEEVYYNSEFTKWCSVVLPDKCNSCVFLPICQGGCRAEQFMGKDGCPIKVKNIDTILLSYANQHTKTKLERPT